jgi:hypothetical protein
VRVLKKRAAQSHLSSRTFSMLMPSCYCLVEEKFRQNG